MHRVRQAHLKAQEALAGSIFAISDIMKETEHQPPSPPGEIESAHVDLSTQGGIDHCLNTIIKNLVDKKQRMEKQTWVEFLNALLEVSDAADCEVNVNLRNARLSLAVTATAYKEMVLEMVVGSVIDMRFVGFQEMPQNEIVYRLLACPASLCAWETSADASRTINRTSSPPQVLLISNLPNNHLRGWVCMHSMVAIHAAELNVAGSCGVMSLFSLIGHISQYELLVHTPAVVRQNALCSLPRMLRAWCSTCCGVDKVPDSQQASDQGTLHTNVGTWEASIWKGNIPRWHSPNRPVHAEELAEELISDFLRVGDFVLSDEQVESVKRTVGVMKVLNTGGMFISLPYSIY